ncbi:tyrosine-protein phosphatase non-receptor type substrate 1-like [Carcharodon carcharias]|uniref:tyrosine-protein phosphatase non-receptor type substrate 1-like n=1 Tax=Carcharodon carcharias TaxID=13397 RepID=UPI001B7E0193|nr:tyrosine-protein phosphatase non-receptor type substrate 1-like [Carcharodon carcharias]
MIHLGTQVIRLCVLLQFFLIAVRSKQLTVFQTPPEIRVLKGGIAQINCSYSDTDEQWRIIWKRNTSEEPFCQHLENINNFTSLGHCAEHANITVDLSTKSSLLIIYDLHLNDSDIYFCEVSFEIPPPPQKKVGKGTCIAVEAAPTVQLRAETLPYSNEDLQLICTSLEFYPENIQVSWFKDGQLITNGTKNGTLYANSDGSFSMTSFLNLSIFDWNEGGNYSCQVNHSTLSAPITERISVSDQGSASDKQLWIIRIVSSLSALMVLVVVAVHCTCSISKKIASSSKKRAMPESDQSARQQSTYVDNVIYSLLGQEHPYDI